MKTAESWSEELCGETSPQAIRQIQSDAIAYALNVLRNCNQAERNELEHTLDVLTRAPNADVNG